MSEVELQVGDKVARIDWIGPNLLTGTVTEVHPRRIAIHVLVGGYLGIDYRRQRPDDWHKVTEPDIIALKDREDALKNARQALSEAINRFPTGKVSEAT